MEHILDILKDRGFIAQTTFEDELYEQLKTPTTFYVGFDPTADSLHIGHYIPIMAMAHMQKAGHKPIALMGGGTAMIGDPSGKTDMRKMMTVETIDHHVECIKKQMARFLDFSDGQAIIVNNGDWLRHLNFIDFMRDIGSMFNVNRMLTAECYKARMATENGLSFLEFTYMLMQSYDFLELFNRYGCRLEMGGNDQWSNMLGGADLVRRKLGEKAFACTFQLLLTHDGRKMGKTEAGALWLDPNKTSPFDFYQYWRNVDDQDVQKCLALLTFLPMDEVRRLGALQGAEINESRSLYANSATTPPGRWSRPPTPRKASASCSWTPTERAKCTPSRYRIPSRICTSCPGRCSPESAASSATASTSTPPPAPACLPTTTTASSSIPT